MNNKLLLEGMIKGIELVGGKFVKVDTESIYFEVIKGSEMDSEEFKLKARKAFTETFGLKLKIKTV